MTTMYTPRPPTIAADPVAASAAAEPRGRPAANALAPARVRWFVRERWLVVLLGAFIPMAIALSLPIELRAPLVAVSLIMAAIGLVMLATRPGGSTANDWHTDHLPPSAAPAGASAVVDVPSRPTGSGTPPSTAAYEADSRALA